jgi:hypothetical protein
MASYKNYIVELNEDADVASVIDMLEKMGADVILYEENPFVMLVEGLLEDKIELINDIANWQETDL